MAASFANNLFLLFLASPVFTVFNLMSSGEAQNVGFSAELIHRDSPKSPFYNASETHSQRLTKAFRRSFSRAYRFNPFAPQSDIIPVPGEYVIKISVGTPPVEISAIADTGSDLIWTQCKPCRRCFKQVAPLFDPKSSSTYKTLSCFSNKCKYLNHTLIYHRTFCPVRSHHHHDHSCLYYYKYGSASSKGQLATDTLILSSNTGYPVPLPNILIGCGRDNRGTFDNKETGIVGLGRGAISLISQMAPLINGKFSYCLVSKSKSSSKIHFGTNAVVSGSEVVSTPLVKNNISQTYYFLTLKAVSVDNERIEFFGSAFGTEEGNIIIDCGTTLTNLPKNFYLKLESVIVSKINAVRVADPDKVFSLCFENGPSFELPNIIVHFAEADVKLNSINFVWRISKTIVCFAFVPSSDANINAIYGNFAQKNFLIGYDTVKETVSFKPTDCSKM